jgi:hypothetical protein
MRPELDRPPVAAPTRSRPVPLHQLYRARIPQLELEPDSGKALQTDAREPENCRRDWKQFAAIWVHLALYIAVAWIYRVEGHPLREGRAFQSLLWLTAIILPIHYALPFRFKKPFFIAASVTALALSFGAVVAGVAVAVSAVLIGISRLPAAWWARVSVLSALAVGLGALRSGIGGAALEEVPPIVWPVLGSMFMFRMIIYLYELKHAKAKEPLLDAIGYFFMLPNYAFLLFPVVDYRTFRRSYFSAEIHETQRVGLRMMVRGLSHLLLYRIVTHQFLVGPDDIQSPANLLNFIVFNYMRYLHVSGQFHIACGMLHLFGYRLPETHHDYFLATGFTDYWRRINIYWKDFMVRVVFNPVAFRLKHYPQAFSLAVATTSVFVVTWALHAYQSFWLSGRFGFSVQDALFWGILGLLVLVNVQRDACRPRAPQLRALGSGTIRALAIRGLKTAGTFLTIAFLWSLWTSSSLGDWLSMFRRAFG